MENPIKDIDFEFLKKQKALLLEIANDVDSVRKLEALEGIISLIDSIQDYAVDTLGIDENEVFDFVEDASFGIFR